MTKHLSHRALWVLRGSLRPWRSLLVCIPNSKNEIATPPFRISELVDTKHRGFAMTNSLSTRGAKRHGDLPVSLSPRGANQCGDLPVNLSSRAKRGDLAFYVYSDNSSLVGWLSPGVLPQMIRDSILYEHDDTPYAGTGDRSLRLRPVIPKGTRLVPFQFNDSQYEFATATKHMTKWEQKETGLLLSQPLYFSYPIKQRSRVGGNTFCRLHYLMIRGRYKNLRGSSTKTSQTAISSTV